MTHTDDGGETMLEGLRPIRRALLSVSDKTGIVDLARALSEGDVELLATGKTYKVIAEAGIPVRTVEDFTGSPEILGGRVKTLHPALMGGILANREVAGWDSDLEKVGGAPVDLVVCNLYPFEETVRSGATIDECIENIDIGGVTLLRAAAKNHSTVAILSSIPHYAQFTEEFREHGGVSGQFRQKLAGYAFAMTAGYDVAIQNYFHRTIRGQGPFPDRFYFGFEKKQDLRYGENSHQQAAFYMQRGEVPGTVITDAKQLGGKELSYNNILDLNDSLMLVSEFEDPTVTVVKHTNPCGVASASTALEAYTRARSGDPIASFGGIVACNVHLDKETCALIRKVFLEAVIAPSYDPEGLEILQRRKSLRILETGDIIRPDPSFMEFKRVYGGLLLQSANLATANREDMKIVAGPEDITPEQWKDIVFAWTVTKHVKSNAIVVARDQKTLGIGAGQMSRVDSVDIACKKAGEDSKGAILTSDAFFPFRDSIDVAASKGISIIVQPGGSIKDEEVIAAANEHGITMVFTGIRHFRH